MNEEPKRLPQPSITDVVREHSGTRPVQPDIPTPVELKPEPTERPADVSFWELITAAIWNRMKAAALPQPSPSGKEPTMFNTIIAIIKSLLLGTSPVTSFLGLAWFLATGLAEYVLSVPSFNNMTLPAFIMFIISRFAKDAGK